MAGEEQASEKLRAYLRQLSPEARAMLMAEVERGLQAGHDHLPAPDLLLEHLREVLRENEDDPAPDRAVNPSRLFFVPIEPFLTDDESAAEPDGRVSRASLAPLWDWIVTEIAPAEAKTFVADVGRHLAAKDQGKADFAARTFQDLVVRKLGDILQAAGKDDKARRRIAFRIGTARAQSDVVEFFTIMKNRDTLSAIGSRLPTRIRSAAGDQLDQIVAVIDTAVARDKALIRYGLILVMNRMPATWHLVRVAVRAAQSDKAERIAESAYGLALSMVLTETERTVRELVHHFRRGQMGRAIESLKDVHEAVRGLRSEVNMSSGTGPARQLAAIRAGVADALKSDLDTIPGRVRRIIRIVPGKHLPAGAAIDQGEVAEIEALLGFLAACKNYASELALNEITLRVLSDLQSQLDNGSRSIIDVLRACEPGELPYRKAQMEAAIRFCAKILGDEFATVIARAAEVAVSSERKAAAKVAAKG
ncbi:hypothetical protein CCR97_07360 [Rhodoplanes elegans]|uniref:Uncharacterized protein n=1 Tax=Rhodoplanes elegans TaxID=29408 RepID=A0A327JTT7_9BRAD|nr:hypothetical protein [Rhodoplanes elegans]MBK5958028.1 hypothetical protein [Rhodoplanes elegans]RAI29889.1 hypothetical protein CH338_28285 [Rhodoplanes elegans]